MKKVLLLLLACVYALTGVWAGTIVSNNGTVTLDNLGADDLATALTDQTVWTSGNASDLNSATKVIFGSKVTLSEGDLAALKTLVPAATQLDMSQVTLDADIANLETAAVEYLQLPNGMTKEGDVKKMATLKTKNTALKVVGAYDGTNTTLPELALYSFAENELSNFSSTQMMNLADKKAMVARLAGTYGDKDLMNNNSSVFGWTPPCIWDFTGATFTSCSLNPGVGDSYYAYNDPFCDGEKSKPGDNYQTNAFWYFSNYSTRVVDIKLPTGMTALPPHCLNDLGAQNIKDAKHKAAFKAYYNVTDDDLESTYKIANNTEGAAIPSLTIPDNYVTLDYECGKAAHIKHLVIGGGVKIVQGGAFYDCLELEEIDFGAGISNCYLGDRAFHGEENSLIKHIALSEGIVSIGFECFKNAQHLESIRLPETLINIGCNAFDNCLALNSITIPKNVDKIGMDAFKLCPFTDIFLTTTDPNKIPFIFTGGNSYGNWAVGASFHHGHYDGWEALMGIHPGNDPDGMTWDDAAAWYYVHANGLPVLHYPKELADKVRADISENYHAHTSDTPSLGLPTSVDMHARETAGGANVGTSGSGIYSRDGWAQFMLMKEFTTDPGGDLYTKKYDDVWYTMCFPFDLTDEQLAAAFNETFNIVDFSAVEINKEENTLTLHFNNVAVTDYKDTDGKHYKRKMNGSNVVREKDLKSKFSYNVYLDDNNQEYHHVNVSSKLESNKTKTFAKGNSLEEAQSYFNSTGEAFIIDGILATAGHPYMIHPAIGVNDGGTTKKDCNFSGVEWKPQTQWAQIFEENSRTIDLGIPKTIVDGNYSHPGYSGYEGQTYTFIGNPKEYVDEAQEAIGDEPQVPEEPVFPVKPENAPTEPTEAEITEAPTVVENPEVNSKYSDDFKELFNTVRLSYKAWDGQKDATFTYTFGEDLVTYDWSEFFVKQDWYDGNYGPWYIYNMNRSNGHNVNQDGNKTISFDMNPLVNYLGANPLTSIDGFNTLKQLAQDYTDDKVAYAQNQIDIAAYTSNKAAWAAYRAALDDYNNWNQAAKEAEYNRLKGIYDRAVAAHTAWENSVKAYKVQIPKNAYFLGRAEGAKYPKYYREIAPENYGGTRTKGLWPQFTAVIIPNAAAVEGIEKTIDGGGALSNSYEIKFNEDFEGDFVAPDDIQTIIEDARKEGVEPKVEYMDIVVNINGQIVRRDTTSFEGLPKGIYIINGKKYFVK